MTRLRKERIRLANYLLVNTRVRKTLVENGMRQGDLAELMGITGQQLSLILKYELAKSEQDKMIALIEQSKEK